MNNTLRIINYLGKHLPQTFSMHEVSKTLGIPYATFHRTIKKIEDLLSFKQIGQAKVIGLDSRNDLCQAYLTIASAEEKKEFLTKQPMFSIVCKSLEGDEVVLLFGSYAKNTQREKSDIDLLIINKGGNRTISFSNAEVLFKKEINPLFVSEKEFKQMLRDKNETVCKQALKGHIILNNPKRFWEFVFDGLR